tara:strand:+ start:72 stop:425 length:354 start_codon:yes stop_codon:yes gene_type:complete
VVCETYVCRERRQLPKGDDTKKAKSVIVNCEKSSKSEVQRRKTLSMQDEIKQRIEAAIAGAQVFVDVDGNRATIAVVATIFAGMSRVKKQQQVYACIEDLIAGGALHAVTIKADAPE